MRNFFEKMFFSPLWYHYFVMILLYPLSIVYGLIMLARRVFSKKQAFKTPIISIGNLLVGGTGKTPFVIALASRYEGVAIVSRGYGRQSHGLLEVSHKGTILTSVENAGDEAMLMAESLDKASVIVSENRILGIELAEKQGAKIIFLDDGFGQVHIEKFDILLEPECMPNTLTFPAGGFREFAFMRHKANLLLKENSDFHREVTFQNLSAKMLLTTSISNPQRLDKYLPDGVIGNYYLEDHAYFDEALLNKQLASYNATSLLVTQKDAIKMKGFKLNISLMKLELKLKEKIFVYIDDYLEKKNVK